MSRFYRDILGRANQLLAEHADEVYLMVCGLPISLKRAE
jgi:adenosylcobinamide kinase/adenosylcobinamide-phosphate guanylyltransferase